MDPMHRLYAVQFFIHKQNHAMYINFILMMKVHVSVWFFCHEDTFIFRYKSISPHIYKDYVKDYVKDNIKLYPF